MTAHNYVLALLIMSPLLFVGCKTQRPTVEIDKHVPMEDSGLMDSTGQTKSVVKVSAFSFPPNPIPYTRISLRLEAPKEKTVDIDNYSLREEIPVKAGVKYALTLVVYKLGFPIYSNAHCSNSNKFTARPGSNNYTVPMCSPIPIGNSKPIEKVESDDEDGESQGDDGDVMIETPAMPGG